VYFYVFVLQIRHIDLYITFLSSAHGELYLPCCVLCLVALTLNTKIFVTRYSTSES
jgi:hypothetical protein